MPVIPALGWLGQDKCCKSEATLSHRVRPCRRKKKGNKTAPVLWKGNGSPGLSNVTGEAEAKGPRVLHLPIEQVEVHTGQLKQILLLKGLCV